MYESVQKKWRTVLVRVVSSDHISSKDATVTRKMGSLRVRNAATSTGVVVGLDTTFLVGAKGREMVPISDLDSDIMKVN